MGTDNVRAASLPQIAILMAVYEPRPDWLREQLASLNAQTYPNLKLYVRDDCSPTVPFEAVQACVAECITAFPYEIARNEENLGSNKTFERLTAETDGELLAYCDQDDVWLPEKLEVRQELLAHCQAHIAKYAMPREIEFRTELPKTLVGKVAYRVLEEEANAALEN